MSISDLCPHCGKPLDPPELTADLDLDDICTCLDADCGHRLSPDCDDAPPCEQCGRCQDCCPCEDNDFKAGLRGE